MKILFVSHEATRTGAPLFLLHLCTFLKKNTDWKLYFLLKRDGPLGKDFAKLGSTIVYQNSISPSNDIVARIRNKLVRMPVVRRSKNSFIKKKLNRLKLDLIYSNTATNGELLHELADLNIKVVTHVHELERVVEYFGVSNLELVRQYSSHYISASPSVTNYFKRIVKKKIFEIKYFPIHSVPENTTSISLRDSLGIPANAFVVGSAGTVEWRKGWDLFIRLAKDMEQLDSENKMYFVWVGNMSDKIKNDVKHELYSAGLEQNVLFIGHQDNPMHYYSMFDVFCLMSREEAFGIVAIENALYGTPILCFNKAEGLASFVEEDAGFVIPYMDTQKMAEAVMFLRNNTELRQKMGKAARKRVEENYTLEGQAALIIDFIKSIEAN